VAYEVQQTDWKADAFVTSIWLASAQAGGDSPRCLVARGASPRWSPDGKRLAFLADHGGNSQIHIINPRSGASRFWTNADSPVTRFAWSPDGRKIAFTAVDGEQSKRRKHAEHDVPTTSSDQPARMAHLWLFEAPENEAAAGPAYRLTRGQDVTVSEFAWSPDGRRIAFCGSPEAGIIGLGKTDIFVVDIASRATRKIVDTPGPDTNPIWSPDGKSLAYQSFGGKREYSYRNHFVAIVPADGGKPRIVTDSFDERAFPVAWGPSAIYFYALQKTDMHLFSVDPTTAAITQVTNPQHTLFWQFSFDREFRHVAFIKADATHYGEVCVSTIESFAPRALTSVGNQLRGFALASREVIHWQSLDSKRIEGVLIKPPDCNPVQRHPFWFSCTAGRRALIGPSWSTIAITRSPSNNSPPGVLSSCVRTIAARAVMEKKFGP
jgi:dipeptidyl aminopeptidase/acylaminoacyl peptidase